MENGIPQEIIPIFLDLVGPIAANAMPSLVHPMPNTPLLQRVPELLSPLAPLKNGRNQDAYLTVHAAMLILADDLDQSHGIVQNISTPQAAAWHAVIHRREGDFWNSNYWWRRASGIGWGDLATRISPLFAGEEKKLERMVVRGDGAYQPAGFTDLVERFAGSATVGPVLVAIQRLEWQSLLHDTLSELTANS